MSLVYNKLKCLINLTVELMVELTHLVILCAKYAFNNLTKGIK